MRYRYLLCDLDNTLMDFDAAEYHSLSEALTSLGLPFSDAIFDTYHHINKLQWEAYERGETTQAKLKVERFRPLLEALGHPEIDATLLAKTFGGVLSTRADLLPGCIEFMNAVHGKVKIALVSNGISATQRGRLARCPFTPQVDAIIISEELGVSKPDPRMVTAALEALGCADKREAVLLGDSATADIASANNAGIDSIHLALRAKPCDKATYVVHDLAEAAALLLCED